MSITKNMLSHTVQILRSTCANLQCTRQYAFKSDLKIKWIRPETVPPHKPEKTGDLEQYQEDLVKTKFLMDFQHSKALQNADEVVKKLFSLQFAPRREVVKYYRQDVMSKVQRFPLDTNSIEAKIAEYTGKIRTMQELMERFPRNKKLKVALLIIADKRKLKLKYLRKWDYKRFEWIIEKLNIVYKPTPLDLHPVTRKDSLRKLTKKYCDELKDDKLKSYKQQLETEQPLFLQEKINTLEYIRSEQKRCNVEVTVTQEEIDEVKEQLAALQKKIAEKEEV